jgi:hypothetical protein
MVIGDQVGELIFSRLIKLIDSRRRAKKNQLCTIKMIRPVRKKPRKRILALLSAVRVSQSGRLGK